MTPKLVSKKVMCSVSRQYLINCSPKHDDYMTIYHFLFSKYASKILCLKHFSLNLSCCRIRKSIFLPYLALILIRWIEETKHIWNFETNYEKILVLFQWPQIFLYALIFGLFQYYALFEKRNNIRFDWLTVYKHCFIKNVFSVNFKWIV